MNTGGPAFPVKGFQTRAGQGFVNIEAQGLSMRDYFAAKAMQAAYEQGVHPYDMLDCAVRAYQMADAMLEARK